MALFGKDNSDTKERTEITSFRFNRHTKAALDELTQAENRASNNNTVVWIIEKEHRKLKRRIKNGKKR